MTTIARRFFIICLIFTIFALLMAAAVTKSNRQQQGWVNGAINTCTFRNDFNCTFTR